MKSVAVLAVPVAVLAGCDQGKLDVPPPPPITGRANAVTAKPAPTLLPTATAAARSAGPPRQLCTGQSARSGPKGSLKAVAAPDASVPPASLMTGVGKWTWINLWAAWCGPCKEEMPRILGWQKKLNEAGVMLDLAFVSLDDDERQMRRFLEVQPPGGVRATYWLPESDRSGWLGSVGLKVSPSLPVQILVAPSGQTACVIEGAVEDRDYPALAAFVSAKR